MLIGHVLFSVACTASAAQWSWFSSELREIEREKSGLVEKLTALPVLPQAHTHECAGFHSGLAPDAESVRWVQVDLGMERTLDAVAIVPAFLGSTEAYGFPLRFRLDASNDPLFAEPVTLLDHTATDAQASLAPWHVVTNGVRARHVRFTATHLVPQPRKSGRFIFCLGELLVFSEGRNVALHATVTAPKAVDTPPTWSPRNLVDGRSALGPPVVPEANPGNGWHSGIENTPDRMKWVQVDLGRAHVLQELRLVPAHPSDYPDRFGFGFPPRFKVELSEAEDFSAPQRLFDTDSVPFANPGDNPFALPVANLSARHVRITATRLWERSEDFVFALAEMQALSAGKNVALGAKVTASDDTITPSWSRERLVDGKSSTGILVEEGKWLQRLSQRRELEAALASLRGREVIAASSAQRRATWGGVTLAGATGWLVLASLRRTHRARKQEMEALRQRISRDLHDEIGSHLGSIRLLSELALRQPGDVEPGETLQEIQRLSREAAESMRGIVWLVREGDAPTLDRLLEALRQSAGVLLRGTACAFSAECIVPSARASLEFHRQVFLFFREAIHNVARHAHATHVEIFAGWNAQLFHLTITDDGIGFNTAVDSDGCGLANLRQRASVIKGTLKVISAPGEGTRITLEAPLA